MLDKAPVGIAVLRGPDLRLVYTNAVYQALFGARPLGRPFLTNFRDLAQSGYALLLDQVMATGEPAVLSETPVTLDYPGSGRRERYFSIIIVPVSLEDGGSAVMAMLLEVTDRVGAEQRDLAFQRYASLARTGALVEWSASAADGAIEVSQGWEEITGQTPEQYQGYGWLDAVAPDDRPALVLAWTQAVEQVPDVFEHTFRVRVRDGNYRHFRSRAVPVRRNGSVVEWTGICTDVEQQWREQRRQDLFTRASAASDTTRIDAMLTALANVIVPDIADACTFYLVPDSGAPASKPRFLFERAAWALRKGLPELPPHHRERFATNDALIRVVQQRRPLHMTFSTGEAPSDLFPAESTRWLRAAQVNSMVVLPLVVGGRVAAVLTGVVCGHREPLGEDDVDLLTDVIGHVEPALGNITEFQRTQRVALALQRSFLGDLPSIPGMPIVGHYQPSPTATHVGGDWYDAFVTDDDAVILTIGDIAGHDLSAAIAMGQLRNMLRAFAVDRPDPPSEVLRRLDAAVDRSGEYEGTATCALARVERADAEHWRIVYSVAGHPPPLLITADGTTRFLEDAHDLLLGLDAERPRSNAVEPLPPGSTLLLYTDGLVEHVDEHLDIGLERLARHCAEMVDTPLEQLCDRLLAELPIAGNDDITMIVLRLGSPAPDAVPVRRGLSA